MFVWLCTFILHLSLAMFLWLCTFNFVKAVGPDISDVKDNVLSFYRVIKITVGVKLGGGNGMIYGGRIWLKGAYDPRFDNG